MDPVQWKHDGIEVKKLECFVLHIGSVPGNADILQKPLLPGFDDSLQGTPGTEYCVHCLDTIDAVKLKEVEAVHFECV